MASIRLASMLPRGSTLLVRAMTPVTSQMTSVTSAVTPQALCFSTSSQRDKDASYKLVVVGGGAGGCAAANMFSKTLGKGQVAVIEPNDKHYYQPLWTLVGGGIRTLDNSTHSMSDVLPRDADWIRDRAAGFDPENCTVTTEQGDTIKYEYLVVAMGLQLNYHLIKGLPEAFDVDPSICSNYWDQQVVKTFPAMQAFTEGNIIFTFPNSPIKCAGAPQKIMYLTEEYLRKNGKRDKANIIYNTALPVIFGVKKYADELMKIVKARNLNVNFRTHLIEVKPDTKEAVFENVDTKEITTYPYAMLHVVPPMSTPDALKSSPLTDDTGFVTVTRETLQHTKYPNVFGIGDNTNVPTAKTAAAVASQTGVLKANLSAVMAGRPTGDVQYDGYTSCPLVTSSSSVIMAEFDWDLQPLETFPFDQGKERRSMYHFKRDVFPTMYKIMLIKGLWHGPSTVRKLLHLGTGR